MPRFEIPNRQVYEYADQIARGAEFLYEHVMEVQCAPSVLLEGALAVELYLKSFLVETKLHLPPGCDVLQQVTASLPATMKKLHPLQSLLDAVDATSRDELQRAYVASPAIVHVPELRDALGRYDNTFVDIRYIYERRETGNLDLNGLISLVWFFREQVARMPVRYRQ